MMPQSIVIVGGGAAGVLVAAALSAHPTSPTRVTVVESEPQIGPGVAYGRAREHHLLNSPAGRMSVYEGQPDHFVDWRASHGLAADPGAFVPRLEYGRYLADVYARLESAGFVESVRGTAVALGDRAVRLHDGRELSADHVVLALGTPPPTPVVGTRVVQDPWAVGALDGIGARDRVLLIGTGLTAVDVATAIGRDRPRASITMTSRHLLLPRVHTAPPAQPGHGVAGDLSTPGRAIRAVREALRDAEAHGDAWQSVIDGIRHQVNDIWAGWSHASRERYIAHVSRTWEVHRHRMSPVVRAELDALVGSGRLRISHAEPRDFDVVIACTGPLPAARTGWNALVDALIASGAARADPLGLGLDVAPEGALIDARGGPSAWASVIGSARRGSMWETTAVPEIRQQAVQLAERVTSSVPFPPPYSGRAVQPEEHP
jgi:uncharacterized NAD(P)/FAD-binding protein YdhS